MLCPNCRTTNISVFATTCRACTSSIKPALEISLLIDDVKKTFGGSGQPGTTQPSHFLTMVDLYTGIPDRPFTEIGEFELVMQSGVSEKISDQYIENQIATQAVLENSGVLGLGIIELEITKEKVVTLLSWGAPKISVFGRTVQFLDLEAETPIDEVPREKTCPFCAETVKFAAIKCKHCGSDIPE